MNPTAAETENGMPRKPQRDRSARQRERHRAEHQQGIAAGAERAEQQQEYQRKASRHDDHQALARSGEVLELSAPRQPVARRAGLHAP